MCGYQGWFRCPGDAANLGWIHWSRDSRRIAPDLLTFEMWPDMTDYPPAERYPAPGFTYPGGRQAELFSSDDARTVLRHFEWMRDYGIDGAWLQHFLVDLPGGPGAVRYPTRLRVLNHVRAAARQTGRVWALSYDIAGMSLERIFDVLTSDWKNMVDQKVVEDPRYLHQGGRPVVQIWGFYAGNAHDPMTVELADRLIDFFQAPGRYNAFLIGGGDWDWRHNPDPAWRKFCGRFGAYCPWNIGNYTIDESGLKHAATNNWVEDKRECERLGVLWFPVVYPGFSWDNLTRQTPGKSLIPRRKGPVSLGAIHHLVQAGCRHGVCGHVRRSGRGHGHFQGHQLSSHARAFCRLRRIAQRLVSAARRRGGTAVARQSSPSRLRSQSGRSWESGAGNRGRTAVAQKAAHPAGHSNHQP